jgi:hypothetical protein
MLRADPLAFRKPFKLFSVGLLAFDVIAYAFLTQLSTFSLFSILSPLLYYIDVLIPIISYGERISIALEYSGV